MLRVIKCQAMGKESKEVEVDPRKMDFTKLAIMLEAD
jgi:hypothetical protein